MNDVLLLLSRNVQSAPRVQSVIDLELMREILLVFGEAQAISARYRFQPARQRVGVNILIYIRSMDDLCQSQKPRLFEAIFENDRLKRAASIGAMTQFDSRRIKGDRAGFLDN